MSFGKDLDQVPVVDGTVLCLVDHYIVEFVCPVFPRFGEVVQYVYREVDQVVVVKHVVLKLKAQVTDVGIGAVG